MAWQKGPLPEGTYGWGGVVKVGEDPGAGFHFADFRGDKVYALCPTGGEHLQADEVAWFDNSLTMPPSE